MAGSIVAGSAVGSSSSTSIAKPTTSGYVEAANDIIIVQCESSSTNTLGAVGLPTGFTQIAIRTNDSGAAGPASIVWGYKYDSGSESWPKTFTPPSGSQYNVWSCIIVRGYDTSNAIDGTPTTAFSDGGNLSLGSITASLAGDLLIIMLSDVNDANVSSWPSGVSTYAPSSNATGNGVITGTKYNLASGATGTLNITMPGGQGVTQAAAFLIKAASSGGSTKPSGAFSVGADVGGVAATAQRLAGSGLVNVGGDVGGIAASAGAIRQTGLVGVGGDVGGINATALKGGVKQASVVMGADVGGVTAQYGRVRNSGPSVMGADTGGVVTTSTGGIFPSGVVDVGGDSGGIQAFAAKQGNGPMPTSYKHQVRMATSFQQLP